MVMKSRSKADRIALAQHLSGEGVAGQEPCVTHRSQWTRHELELDQVMAANASNLELRAAAAPLQAMCGRCPRTSVQACGTWALVEEFSGVAGGTLLRNGRVLFVEHRSRGHRDPSESAA